MYTRVLLAYDGSDRSLAARPVAEAAASAWDCELTVVHVPVEDDAGTFDGTAVEMVPASDPATGLVEAVHATDPQALLCCSSRGRGAPGEMVFGSVAAGVIRQVHAPTLVVGPQVHTPAPGP